MHQETGKVEPVGIDDACMFMCRFANGSLGLFESTRYARGHKALKTFELNGADGSVMFDLHEPEYLDFFEYRAAETARSCPATSPAGAASTSPTASTPTWGTGGCRAW